MPSAVAIAQANFALNLIREAGPANSTLILSPFSITVALAAAYIGANGDTKTQIRNTLASGIDEEDLNNYLHNELVETSKSGQNYTLNSANALYVDKQLTLLEKYVYDVQSKFAAQVETADFSQAAATAKEINTWVEEKTNSKIQDLFSAESIPDSGMIIANAVYFKGQWADKFDPNDTKSLPFYTTRDQHRQVDMMRMNEKVYYNAAGGVQVLGLPYESDKLRMYFFLPTQRFGLQKLEKSLTGSRLMELIQSSSQTEVNLTIPKFKLELKVELPDVLKKMGIVKAFSKNDADFSGISTTPLFLSEAVHKAFVEINEEGTEAAAATGLVAMPMSLIIPETFTADHPFLFAIVKEESILFLGRYV